MQDPIERKIAVMVVRELLNAGFAITVNDSEEDTLENSLDQTEVLDAMFTSDEDWLYANDPVTGVGKGWVRLIYGNEVDVLSDYSTSIEADLAPVLNRIELLIEEREGR